MKKLDGTITLSLLDEDNSQRVIFRIFPLCTKDGLIFSNRKQSYPDFGSLRIIPDKREQSSFKERMREIGPLCCVQLADDGKELTKIRQNRNYDPNQGECNQYAIYSDVICGFEQDAVFEVYQENQPFSQALTENVLLQRGKILFGPISRDADVDWDDLKPFGNEDYLMHSVEDAEGKQRAYYWNPEALVTWKQRKRELKKNSSPKPQPDETIPEPAVETLQKQEPEPKQEAKAVEEPLPIGMKLEILNEDLSNQEQITELNKPVSFDANRLVDTPAPPVPQQPKEAPKFHGTPIADAPKSNRSTNNGNGFVHGVVEKQIKEKQSNGTPPQTERRPVENPLENLTEAFQHVWDIPALHQELFRRIGENNDIKKAILESPNMNGQANSSFAAVKAELDEIEGERLLMLVELDKVKENYQQIKEKMFTELSKQKRDALEEMDKRLEALAEEKRAAEETLAQIGESIRLGTLELVSQKAAVDVQTNGSDIVLSPTIGMYIEPKELVETVRSLMNDMGFMCKQDCVTSLMILLSLHDELCVTADSIAEAELYVKNVLRALGLLNVSAFPTVFGNVRVVSLLPENDLRTPTVEVIRNDRTPIHAYGHKTIRLLEKKNMSSAGSLPVLRASEFNKNRGQESLNQYGRPVSLRTIQAFADRTSLLYKDSEAWPVDFKQKLDAQGIELSDEARIAARMFVRAAAPQLIGGFKEAVDTAALVWVVPRLIAQEFPKDRLSELIGDLPKCMRAMAEAEY